MHHLYDIACRWWHLPYCYAMHALAEGTLPPANVHSGNPVTDGQVVPFNLLDLHAPCWRNNHLIGLTRLDLLF